MLNAVLLLTGQSGSGKSTAVRALEDQGFFCVDNIPSEMVLQLVDHARGQPLVDRLAIVMDARAADFVKSAPQLIAQLRSSVAPFRMAYFEASTDALVRRYSETRRRHPLDTGEGLRAAIEAEHELLAPLRELADDHFDTSSASPYELRKRVVRKLGYEGGEQGPRVVHVELQSFGYKHGMPVGADIVLDVRFLPNPYFDSALRDHTGLDEEVFTFVCASDAGRQLLDRTEDFLAYLVDCVRTEGRRYLSVAVGCTGGQHRSVAVARALADRLEARALVTQIWHRDIPGAARAAQAPKTGSLS